MWGFDSIGAIATKKPHGARALQETFPTVFADTFASMGSPQAYLPDHSGHHAPLEQGDSFQSSYHEEKKRDADRMARAKVHSTRMMNTRAFSSHNGYYGMPKPVLGQRVFANETGGVFSMNSARRDHASAPFHYSDAHGGHDGALLGGVLRSAEGQGYGKARLMDRIAQLNAIEANAGNFTQDPRDKVSAPTSSTTSFAAAQQQGESSLATKLELFQLLQGINDSLLGSSSDGITSFTYKDTTRALTLMFRLVPTMEDYELADLQTTVSSVLEKLNGAVADPDGTDPKTYEIAVTLNVLFDKIHDYLTEFAQQTTQFGTRTDDEKLQISKTLVKTLKFASSLSEPRLEAESRYQPMAGETSTENESLVRRHYEAESAARRDGRSSTTSSSSSGGVDPQLRYARQDAQSSARFSSLAPTREDQRAEQIAQQSGLGTFDVDERGAFGNNAGHFYPTGGRDVGYVEEGIDGPPQQPFTALPERGPMIARVSTGVGAPVVREGAPEVRGVFDEDTQQFDVEVGRAEGEGPRFTEALPTTREGFDALARRINALPEGQRPTKDGRPIQVYASSTLPSIRKNFRRRLRF